ncbi:MAG: hypothetical protein KatS3mg113_0272 [Planctomycetaceae bacterium]|nr:MAG: hypothetical protein KatS3mg113_0272 [Planctomycetaceae bacterium]
MRYDLRRCGIRRMICRLILCAGIVAVPLCYGLAQNPNEITPQSEAALERGLKWLARQQGAQGHWESNDLGLVALGALAFMAAGHLPGQGPYGQEVQCALDFLLRSVKPSGLLNIADPQRDMYNHGLATFVLGQAYGMTDDARLGMALDRALQLIMQTQCDDGGWDYRARRQERGHDLSLVVMQAKALRSAMDSGFEVRPDTIRQAIRSVREHYRAENHARGFDELGPAGARPIHVRWSSRHPGHGGLWRGLSPGVWGIRRLAHPEEY